MKKILALAACLVMLAAGALAQKRALFDLAQYGTLQEVQAAIAAGAKVNDVGGFPNNSVLYFSTLNKDPRVLTALLKAGADPNWKGIPGKPYMMTPIESAAMQVDPGNLKLLLAADAKPDFPDGQGLTALEYAAGNPNPEAAALLFKAGVRASPRASGDITPIQPICIVVALNSNSEVIKLFLDNGGDPNVLGTVGNQGGTPLSFAIMRNRSAEIFALLIKAGANVTANDAGALGISVPPLFELVQTARADLVPLFAKAGADVNAKLPTTMVTPLMVAAIHTRNPAMIHALVAAGARINDRDANANTALIQAAAQGKEPSIITALLADGADPSAKNGDRKSAYDYALINEELKGTAVVAALKVKGAVSLIEFAKTASAEAMRAAIRNGSDVNERDLNGQTPLTVAVQYNRDSGVVSALLAGGARADDPNGIGRTPLMIASESNPDPAFIAILVKAGADPNARTQDMFKLSPTMIAAASNAEPKVVAALAAAGADLQLTDALGRTALIMAADQNPNPKVLGALLKAGADAGIIDLTQRSAFDYAKAKPIFKGSPELAVLQTAAAAAEKAAAAAAAESAGDSADESGE